MQLKHIMMRILLLDQNQGRVELNTDRSNSLSCKLQSISLQGRNGPIQEVSYTFEQPMEGDKYGEPEHGHLIACEHRGLATNDAI